MKVVNLFIGSFVISCLTLNNDVLAGCCCNKNNKGNNNSSNNNGSKQTPPSKKSNSTTTSTTPPITTTTTTTSGAKAGVGFRTTATTTGATTTGATTTGAGFRTTTTTTTSGAKAAATTTTTPEATTTGAGLGAGFGTTTTTPEATTTGAGLGAGFGTTTSTTGATKTSTTTTVPLVEKITEIQNVGGINGLTARLQGGKIYLSINNQIFMENVDTYNNDSISQESIKNVKMKFSNGTSLASLPIYNGSGITIGVIVMYINGANKIPLKNSLSEHNLMYGQFDKTDTILVIDLTTFKVYKEVTRNYTKHYFAYAQNESKNWNYGFYFFTPETSAYGYYKKKTDEYYWSNANGSSIKTPNGFNQYNFYKSKFELHTIYNEGASQA